MHKYEDIINLEHFHASGKPYMSNTERAAQFMPFKAMDGYDEGAQKELGKNIWNERTIIVDEQEFSC